VTSANNGGARAPWRHSVAAPALVFFTSAAVLVLEIVAGRLVAPYVGVTLETYTGIIGTVLAGIAVGSAIGGRVADRVDARTILGPLLIAAGAASWLVLPIVRWLGPLLSSGGSQPAAIVVLALCAFVLPTALLSAVSPMAAKLRLESTAETGRVVGSLSAFGTAGALVGTFLTGFVFIAAVPTSTIVGAVGATLAAAGAVLVVRERTIHAAPPLAALVLVGALAVAAPEECQFETRYYCANVVIDADDASRRALHLDSLRHSYVDLDDAEHLEFRYTKLFAAVIDAGFDHRPLDVVHIGGGGFTMPRWITATRPGSQQSALELDPGVVQVAEEELGLDSGTLRIRTGDARVNIASERDATYDVAIGDAFSGLSVPWHLATVEMAEEVRRVLRPNGLYVLNVIDGGERRLVRAETATLLQVFEEVAVITPPGGPDGNYVVIASDSPIALPEFAPSLGSLVATDDLPDFIRGARQLTDDFAPADQLLSR
jgi:MFS family permease